MMAAMLAGSLLAFSVTHSAGTGSARQEFGFIETAAAAENGLAQLREIDVSVNSLLNTRNLMASPEFDRWRTVNEILNSNLRNNCKDYVVLKEARWPMSASSRSACWSWCAPPESCMWCWRCPTTTKN